MDDLKPFRHNEKGTHSVCDKHLEELGGKGECCVCEKKDCSQKPREWEKKIQKILRYALEHNGVGHEIDDDFECPSINRKTKNNQCECGWEEYEKTILYRFVELLETERAKEREAEKKFGDYRVAEARKQVQAKCEERIQKVIEEIYTTGRYDFKNGSGINIMESGIFKESRRSLLEEIEEYIEKMKNKNEMVEIDGQKYTQGFEKCRKDILSFIIKIKE